MKALEILAVTFCTTAALYTYNTVTKGSNKIILKHENKAGVTKNKFYTKGTSLV